MPEKHSLNADMPLPKGFTVHSSKRSAEYARELGWGINEEERTRTPQQKQDYDGGMDYEYGARDFGDRMVDKSSAKKTAERSKSRPMHQKKSAA